MQEIDIAEAIRRVTSGARLVDVRERQEWDDGHAPTAVLVPTSEFPARWQEIAVDDDPALIICHSGHRSAMVADALERAGVPAVSVAGGMVAWAQTGGPIVRGGAEADATSEPGSRA